MAGEEKVGAHHVCNGTCTFGPQARTRRGWRSTDFGIPRKRPCPYPYGTSFTSGLDEVALNRGLVRGVWNSVTLRCKRWALSCPLHLAPSGAPLQVVSHGELELLVCLQLLRTINNSTKYVGIERRDVASCIPNRNWLENVCPHAAGE
jgi:hypothetical protein